MYAATTKLTMMINTFAVKSSNSATTTLLLQTPSLNNNILKTSRQRSLSPVGNYNKPLITCRFSMPNTITSTTKVDPHIQTIEETRERIRKDLLTTSMLNPAAGMELIDTIERLGIGHCFEDEISMLLQRSIGSGDDGGDLFHTALRFRLLRHNGFPASTDVFNKFMYKNGKFKESLSEDSPGMLSLYEASYLCTKDEVELLQAMEFTRTRIEQLIPCIGFHDSKNFAQALELPRHLRMPRLEARNYIHQYSFESNRSASLIELAKSEFNTVQSLQCAELAELTRWWKQLGLVEKLDFARDRPTECYLWTVGIFPDPSHSNCRIQLAKTIALLLVIDDIFDSYGSLTDLALFTDAITRWDLRAIETLPEYMKICYMALYNTTNDIAYEVLKDCGRTILPYLKQVWIDVFEAFLVEAKWFKRGYVPTLNEYLSNGVITGGTCMALVHAFFLLNQDVSNQPSLTNPYPHLFFHAGEILRLWDDLGTAKEEQKRGDVASSIECYMRQDKVTCEEEARKHVRKLIRRLWIDLNSEMVGAKYMSLPIIKASLNVARTAQTIYQHGDTQGYSVDDHVQMLIFNPI